MAQISEEKTYKLKKLKIDPSRLETTLTHKGPSFSPQAGTICILNTIVQTGPTF